MKSFFEKLTGAVNIENEMENNDENNTIENGENNELRKIELEQEENQIVRDDSDWMEEKIEEGELTIDMYQKPDEIIIKTMVAGVKPSDLDISISRDMITIRGSRKESNIIDEENYFAQELYWGSFSRTITLPSEIDIEEAEAEEKHGLLILRLPKIDKGRQTKLKVKQGH